ncbi:MAG: hypothetical protein HY328_16870 [Chloroflexi bacterium]|nr:hypothetical protein [Chloroflexota bacterium]
MTEFTSFVQHIVLYTTNGALATLYIAWEHGTALVTLACFLWFLRGTPEGQRTWIAGAGGLAVVAALFAPPPVPVLLAGMAALGAGAVALDRFQPDALRWRVVGVLALYAAGALGYLGYSRYLAGVDAAAWAEAIGGQEQAQNTLAQGQAFLNTLATWGLWLILPLGYLSLLAQGLLAHPPLGERPAETIARVRTRGR